MKFIGRMMLFVLVAGLSVGPALIGCDEGSKSDNDLLMMVMALMCHTPDKIYIYSGGQHDGFLANRASADSLCKIAASGITALSNRCVKKAFISFSGSDQIKNLVDTQYQALPVVGIKASGTETSLKDSWSNLWNGSGLDNYLSSATDILGSWWSGSDNNGTSLDAGKSCREWTCNANPCIPAAVGYLGADFSIAATWVNPGANATCEQNAVWVLCVAY
jgi:hypothetical protein